jgi:hypothetical protein
MRQLLQKPEALPDDGLLGREVSSWSAGAAGLVLVAGVLHLTALPAHLQEARGTGFYFFAVGAAQVVWAGLFLTRPTRGRARFGLSMLAVAPVALWVLTRVFRSPWSGGPEPLDFVSVATVILQIGAAAVLLGARLGRPTADGARQALTGAVVVLVVLGLAAGAASYGGAIAAEASIPWLGEPEADHHESSEEPPGTESPSDEDHHH